MRTVIFFMSECLIQSYEGYNSREGIINTLPTRLKALILQKCDRYLLFVKFFSKGVFIVNKFVYTRN
jgi:hypothetical protein